MLPVQCPNAQGFERPELTTSEFGARKGLLMEKAPSEKMGDLLAPQIHLQGQGTWFSWFAKTSAESRIPLLISMSLCKRKQAPSAGRPWEQRRLPQDGVRETEPFTRP